MKTSEKISGRGHARRSKQEQREKEEKTTKEDQGRKHTTTLPYDGTFASRSHRLYLPSALDKLLVGLVGRNSRHLDHYRWVISSIIFLRVTDKRFERDSFIPLNQEVLRSIISKRKLTLILADLCKWGFIEQNRSWLAGSYSMSYRLMEPFTSDKVKALHLADKGMNKRLERFRANREIIAQKAGPGYASVHKWLHYLHIDRVRAMSFIRKRYQIYSEEYKARFIAIDHIANGLFFFTVDGKAGRAHHNLSNLAADLRQFVTVEGQPLVQVDISNSQPLFLHLTISTDRTIDQEEVERMSELVSAGRFYDMLKPEGAEREQFKKEIYRDVLFGAGTYTNTTTAHFRSQFPCYADAIDRLKVPDFRNVAVTLQALEAKVIFKAVERFAHSTGYMVPILTIHDSLVTVPEYVELAEQELHGVFQKQYGIVPPTRIKAG